MKKYLVVFMSLIFVLSLSLVAFAGVELGGDATIRGIWKKNYDLNDDNDVDERFFDERVRLKVNADAGNGASLKSRVVLVGRDGDEVGLDGDNTVRGAFYDTDTEETTNAYVVDYAYITVPVANLTVDAGIYKRSFGNTLYMIDNRVTTVQVSGEFGNVAVSAFLDKERDTSVDGTTFASDKDNLEDHDNWGLTAVTTVNDVELGAMIYMEKDNVPKDATPAGDEESGTEIDVFANANVDNIAISAEIARTSGDISGNEDAEKNAKMGMFVAATAPVNQINVTGAIAYAKDGFTADKHFTPTLFLGKDQATAIMDFGATDEATALALAVTAGYDVSSDLSVYGRLAYLSQKEAGVVKAGKTKGEDASATEFDAGLAYKLGKNVTYNLDFGYLSPSDYDMDGDGTEDKDAAIALAHGIELVF